MRFLAGPRGYIGGLKAQVGGLGSDFAGSWRPCWGHVGDLGCYFGDLRAYVGRSWLGKANKRTSYRYLRGLVASPHAKIVAGVWHMLRVGGARVAALLKQEPCRILAFHAQPVQHAPAPFGGGGFHRFARSAGPGSVGG